MIYLRRVFLSIALLLVCAENYARDSDMLDIELRYFLSQNSKFIDIDWLTSCSLYSGTSEASESKFPNLSPDKRKGIADLTYLMSRLLNEIKRTGSIGGKKVDDLAKLTDVQVQKHIDDVLSDLSQPGLSGPIYSRCVTKLKSALAASNDVLYGRIPFQYDEEKSWEKLSTGANVVLYIDKSSVTRNNTKVRVWLFRRYSSSVCVENCNDPYKFGTNADAVKFYVDIDCTEGLYRVLSYETRVSQGFLDKALIGTLGEQLGPLLDMFGTKVEPFSVLQSSNKVEEWRAIVDKSDLALQKNLCAKNK